MAFSAILALAVSDQAPSYGAPAYRAPTYKEPSYKAEPASYSYGYDVKDDYAGVNFG